MTAGETTGGKPATARESMCLQSRNRVMRAARIETAARPEQRADQNLVGADEEDGAADEADAEEAAMRVHSRSRLWRSCGAVCDRLPGLARMTRSTAGRLRCCRRKVSRICRLSRLRSTESGSAFFEMAKPKRAWASVLAALTAVKLRSCIRTPRVKTVLNCAGFSKRALLGKRAAVVTAYAWITGRDACGPWRDGARSPRGHPWSPYGRGSRACEHDAASWADKCAWT